MAHADAVLGHCTYSAVLPCLSAKHHTSSHISRFILTVGIDLRVSAICGGGGGEGGRAGGGDWSCGRREQQVQRLERIFSVITAVQWAGLQIICPVNWNPIHWTAVITLNVLSNQQYHTATPH